MDTYAKLSPNGALETLHRIPHISNPSEETKAAYAAAHGYKPVIHTPAPSGDCTSSWQETETEIRQVWTAPTIEEARERAMQQVQQWRNAAMSKTCTLDTPLGWPLEYTQEAVSLAQGNITLMLTGLCETTSWTDARNIRHDGLTLGDMKVIALALAGHIRGIQDKADALRLRISTATAEEIPGILQGLQEPS